MQFNIFNVLLWSLGGVGLLYAASKSEAAPKPKRAYELAFRAKDDGQAQKILDLLDTVGAVSDMSLGDDTVAPNGRMANLFVKWVGVDLSSVLAVYQHELVYHADKTRTVL